jgi:hypothetical protein
MAGLSAEHRRSAARAAATAVIADLVCCSASLASRSRNGLSTLIHDLINVVHEGRQERMSRSLLRKAVAAATVGILLRLPAL